MSTHLCSASTCSGFTHAGSVRGGRRRRLASGLVSAVLALSVLAPAPAIVRASPAAQRPGQHLGENNIDYDTVALSHFLFDDKTKPSGYSLTTTVAYPNDAEAFDSVMVPPADPRPMEELFKHLEESGRELRLRQDMANDADDSAPELRYAIVLFDSPEHAANALTDPSLLDFVLPDAQVSPLTVPNLGDASAGYTIDETRDPEAGPDRALLMAWQRGRVVLTA